MRERGCILGMVVDMKMIGRWGIVFNGGKGQIRSREKLAFQLVKSGWTDFMDRRPYVGPDLPGLDVGVFGSPILLHPLATSFPYFHLNISPQILHNFEECTTP